jgi:hypothetical protein
MNGRIYDPLLGRFLSADVVVDGPGDLQGYNRYSYVKNRPLSVTDPTGFFGAYPGMAEDFKAANSSSIGQVVGGAGRAASNIVVVPIRAVFDNNKLTTEIAEQWIEDENAGSEVGTLPGVVGVSRYSPANMLYSGLSGSDSISGRQLSLSERSENIVNTFLFFLLSPTGKNKPAATPAQAAGTVATETSEALSTAPKPAVVNAAPDPVPVEPSVSAPSAELQGPGLIPNNATVVRGGATTPGGAASPEGITNGSGVVTGSDGNVSGVSVNAGVKPIVELAVPPIRNGQISVTTAGAIRDAGGAVTPAPNAGNPIHALVSDLTAKQLSELLKQQKNPNK